MENEGRKIERRNTKSKAVMLECIRNMQDEHFTADELIDRLKANGTPVSKSTVYRFLSELESEAVLKKYATGEKSSACYLYSDNPEECSEHFHLMCKDCGKITHFENDSLQKLLKKLDDANGFSIYITESPFYGICENCVKNKKKGNK